MRPHAAAFIVSFACSGSSPPHEQGSEGPPPSTSSIDRPTDVPADVPTDTSTGAEPNACNGHVELCARRVDEVTFASTHNSMAATDAGFSAAVANQHNGLRAQLEDGIRGMLLDVYEEAGERWLCHGPCGLGKIAHVEAIVEIGDFLTSQPGEVLVVIYEDHASTAAIAQDWATSGYEPLLYTKQDGAWPTLGELVAHDTRVIVTAENGGPPPTWLHHVWDLAWDTAYTFHAIEEFDCELNRGSSENDLFLVNHWVSTELDLPDASAAGGSNAAAVLQARVDACRARWGHPVNLLAVDFYDEGDLFAVVDASNGL